MSETADSSLVDFQAFLHALSAKSVGYLDRMLAEAGEPLPAEDEYGTKLFLHLHFLCHFILCTDMIERNTNPNHNEQFIGHLTTLAMNAAIHAFLPKDSPENVQNGFKAKAAMIYQRQMDETGARLKEEPQMTMAQWLEEATGVLASGICGELEIQGNQDIMLAVRRIRGEVDEVFSEAVMNIIERMASIKNPNDRNIVHISFGSKLEIHFYQQEEVYVFLETNTGDEIAQQFAELLLLASYVIRQVSNVGPGDTSTSIGFALGQLARSNDPLSASMADFPEVELVPFSGGPGRKRFLCEFWYSPEKLDFTLDAKGFGIMASGIGYYVPVSIIALIKFLARKRQGDIAFAQNVRTCISACSTMILAHKISLANHSALVRVIGETIARSDS